MTSVSCLDLTKLTLREVASQIRSGLLTSTELTSAYLSRIKRFNPKLNSYITITEDAALRSAQLVDDELKAGKYRGPLHGIPVAVKDLFETKGIRTTAGSKILTHNIPSRDAFVIERLTSAGAVLLGK